MSHTMYVLACADGSLYTGYTVDVARRLGQHNAGKASKYTRTRRPVKIVLQQPFATQREAMQAEWAFKQLTRSQKLRRLAESTRVNES